MANVAETGFPIYCIDCGGYMGTLAMPDNGVKGLDLIGNYLDKKNISFICKVCFDNNTRPKEPYYH